jgi:signal transduction histidine kinase/DNA-binding response OmpR family regulator
MIVHRIRRSVSRKFLLATLTTTFMSLLVSAAAMLAYDLQTYRSTWAEDLGTLSEILARVSTPALEFNDPAVGSDNLAQLRTRPNVLQAALYGPDGRLFAQYRRDAKVVDPLPATPGPEGFASGNGQVTQFRRMMRDRELIGTLYLSAQYPLWPRVQRYVLILGAVMAGSLLVAFLLSLWLSQAVTRPILAVTEAVHRVIGKRDFTHLVHKSTDDEIGVFVDAFNSMLTEVGERSRAMEQLNHALRFSNDALEHSIGALRHEVQERIAADEALHQLNSTLEVRIAENTEALTRAHEQLRHSQKMDAIGQLTGGVAHDFNNVLQVISGNLQMLQLALANEPNATRRLATAAFAADRGAKLASQLLAFARRQPLQPVPVNLRRILRDMEELVRRALGETIRIEPVIGNGVWNTLIDPNQIENVILNLAINARDAMPTGGTLTLELENATLEDAYVANEPDLAAGQYVMLAISDTGAGMSREIQSRAFEPFFTTKPEGQGTGLGLSMAYGFVKQSHGHIVIDSEVGNGTTVRIFLPRANEEEVAMLDKSSTPAVGGNETILVVEDDPSVQATAIDMLSGLGYRVLNACDGESALEILHTAQPIDLLFSDVVMPGPVRSPDLAKTARQLIPGIAVLFTSGYTQDAIMHGGRLDAGVELISKPYRREDLARKIRHVLANRKMTTTLRAASQEAMTMPAVAIAGGANRSLDILVVEDNADALEMLEQLLGILGHKVHGVTSAEEALQVASERQFGLLLTDQTLPGLSGFALATQLFERQPALKIILSSGYPDVGKGAKFPCRVLPKPYTLEQLRQLLSEV